MSTNHTDFFIRVIRVIRGPDIQFDLRNVADTAEFSVMLMSNPHRPKSGG